MAGELLRGAKWFEVKRVADLKGQTKTIDWMNSQISIVNDIKVYEDSLVAVEEPIEPVDYSSMTVAELETLIDENNLDRSGVTLKADLILILEGA